MRPTNRELQTFCFPVQTDQPDNSSSEADRNVPSSSVQQDDSTDAEEQQSAEEMEEVQEIDDERLNALEDVVNDQLQEEENQVRMELLQQMLSTVQQMRALLPNTQSDEFQSLVHQLQHLKDLDE